MRIIGITGWSGAGKTTLILKLIPLLTAQGLKVSTLKHAHHMFDVDTPGKDSYEHRAAGATEVLIASQNRFALMHELRGNPEPPLEILLSKLSAVDLVLVEGFKRAPHPKIEVFRSGNGKTALFPDNPSIVGIASDITASDVAFPNVACPVLDINDTAGIAALIQSVAVPASEINWKRSDSSADPRTGNSQAGSWHN
jgi:molybdopterin-guanine dinucleotide biosynthesis adapter protein